MRFVKFIAFCALLLFSVQAQAKTFNAESFTLPNGLRVVVIPNHRAPVVTHMVWYQFGSADEARGTSGIAHFLEHLMFKGTPQVADGAFSKTVRKIGGNDNAFTTRDYTAYYQNIPKDALPKIMEMEADRMKNLTLEEDEVASERQVIIEERHQRIDNQPQALFSEQMTAAQFINHPYGTPVIGWLQEMEKLTREDALYYYKKWYAPNNAVVILSGDITADEVKPLAEKYYGILEPNPSLAKRVRPVAAPLIAENRLQMSDARVGIPVLLKTWRAPRGNDALDTLGEIFGGTSTSRLYKSLVIDQKLAVSTGMSYEPFSMNETTITVYASPAPGVDITTLESALDAEMNKLIKDGVTAEELDRAKKRKKSSFTLYLDSLQGPAMLFGRAISTGFDIDYLEGWSDRIDALTPADIKNAAALVFKGGSKSVTGILLPADKGATP